MRSDDDGIAKTRRFHKILSAMRNQRSADKDQRCQRVPDAKFADGVGNIDVRVGSNFFSGRPQGGFEAEKIDAFLDLLAALRVAGGYQRKQAGKLFF